MSTTSAQAGEVEPASDALGRETLYAVIGAIARGPDLGQVLQGVVDLLTDATACHACFVYLTEGETLQMRAASSPYEKFVGQISMRLDEGLCGWVARNCEPAFLRENAIADPRMKLFSELDEESFRSMIAVPLAVGPRDVIGVVVLHTRAPREFDQEVVDFLVNVASVVAGAIHNAGLYEEARLRAELATALTGLGQEIAAVGGRDDLYRLACEGTAGLLDATAARLFLVDRDDERLDAVAASGTASGPGGVSSLLPSARGHAELTTRLAAGTVELGMLTVERPTPAFGAEDQRLLDTIGNQLAVTLQRIELIEQLTGDNLLGDLFEALEDGRTEIAEACARSARYDLARLGAIAVIEPAKGFDGDFAATAERATPRLRRLVPGILVDTDLAAVRTLMPLPPASHEASLERLDAELRRFAEEEKVAIGRSQIRPGLAEGDRGLAEAVHAAGIVEALEPAGGMGAYAALGVYRYLERGSAALTPDDRQTEAITTLQAYDRKYRSSLMDTLEHYLEARSGVAQVARDLYIHPNTLRKRLERIEELTGLDLGVENLLCLELAIKLARLRAPA
ncbi:MAG TPA: GAF domain-containing protein [Solirubrobacterales bacterium]